MKDPLTEYRKHDLSLRIEQARKDDARRYYMKYEQHLIERRCPVCGAQDHAELEPYANAVPVAHCEKCGCVYVKQTLPLFALSDYYENSQSARMLNEFYAERNATNRNCVSSSRLDLAFNVAIKVCKKLNKQNLRILDVGCGEGEHASALAHKLSSIGIQADLFGIEPSLKNQDIAKGKGIDIVKSFIGEGTHLPENDFDLILAFELIEHLSSPADAMLELHHSLVARGGLIISTPNIEGLENIATGYNGIRVLAHAICPPAHLQGFSRITLALLAHKTGFSIQFIKASGSFDVFALSYYKSLRLVDENIARCVEYFEGTISSQRGKNDGLQALQYVVNALNGSSTMSAVFWK